MKRLMFSVASSILHSAAFIDADSCHGFARARMNKSIKKFLPLAAVITILMSSSPAIGQVTGIVNFTDSLYAPIGAGYPPGTARVFAEVVDADKNLDPVVIDTLSVVFSSPSDSGEIVVLSETGVNTGTFHGWINLDVLPVLLFKEKPIRAWMEEFQKTEKSLSKPNDRATALMKDFRDKLNSGKEISTLHSLRMRLASEGLLQTHNDETMALMKDFRDQLNLAKEMKTYSGIRMSLASDSLLQIHTGETMALTYYDEKDSAGTAETITKEAVLGGVSGAVSGVWTKANSPYTVTSGATVNAGDTLRIEAGVVVNFLPQASLVVYGDMESQGTEGDSVYFNFGPTPDSVWEGVVSFGMITAHYTVFSNGGFSLGSILAFMGEADIINSTIRQSKGYGLLSWGDMGYLWIDSSVVQGNKNGGIDIEQNALAEIMHSSVINNDSVGIRNSGTLWVLYSNLYVNGNWEIYNASPNSVNAAYDWWGDSTTAEMNAGGNPKNITRIYDYYDSSGLGMVGYARWIGSTFTFGRTGQVWLTDSLYKPISDYYPIGTARAYVEVYDYDKNTNTTAIDTLSVVFRTPSDSGETVVLTETGPNTAKFHGSIGLDIVPGLLYKGRTIQAWMEEIRKTEKDSTKWNQRATSLMNDIRDELERGKNMKNRSGMRSSLASDGFLQIHSGDTMTVTYYDQLTYYGNPIALSDSAWLGGVSGAVSGTWTKANSPYLVTSDVYVNAHDSLKIGPGVVVKFMPQAIMYVYGKLETQGASGDSVYFTSSQATPSPGDWKGVLIIYSGTMTARFTVFSYGGSTINYSTYYNTAILNYGIATLDNCAVRNNHWFGIICLNQITIRDCILEQNPGEEGWGTGLCLKGGRGSVFNSIIQNNEHGVQVWANDYGTPGALTMDSTVVRGNTDYGIDNWNGTATIQHSTITNNGMYGIASSGSLTVQNSTITNDSTYGIYNSGSATVQNCAITNNSTCGIYSTGGLTVQSSTITNNGTYGISSSGNLTVQNTSLYGNGTWDVWNGCACAADARYNSWGDSTTAEMNAGENPKDISRIYDHFDNSGVGIVDYSGWTGNTHPFGNTGTAQLTDSLYSPVGVMYPDETVRAFAEVVDQDKNIDTNTVDTVNVIFSSPSDSGETVVLHESGANTGVFRGWISLDVLPGLLYQGRTVRAWMEEIRKTEKDPTKWQERIMTLMNEIRDELKRGKTMKTPSGITTKLASDGLLQVHVGDTIRVTYYDSINKFGDPQAITNSAVLGGVSGAVSGVWRKTTAPYFVLSDVYVNSGDTLKIEPGVVVKFRPGKTMYVYGTLEAEGINGDSVYFTSALASPSPGDWGGVFINGGTMAARFTVFSCGGYLPYYDYRIYAYGGIVNSGTTTLYNCALRYSRGCGILCYSGGQAGIRDCIIEQNIVSGVGGMGIYLYWGSATVNNSTIQNNGYGIYSTTNYWGSCPNPLTMDSTIVQYNVWSGISYGTSPNNEQTFDIRHSSITNNGNYAITTSGPVHGTVHNSNLYGNGQYEVYDGSSYGLNADSNWWGEATTAEMNAGGNPKNIGKICDSYDYGYLGTVSYSEWREEPVSLRPKEMLLPLMSGWNLVSWNLKTSTDSTAAILSRPMGNLVVALGFENTGLTFDPHMSPEYNTLTQMDPYHGYWLKMKANDSLLIDGNTLERNTPIYLESGYNLVSYLPTLPDSVRNAIRSVYDKTTVVLGFNDGGLTYDPAIPPEFNTLTFMQPGFGYWIKTTDADTLIYPHVPLPMALKPTFASAGRNCQKSDGVTNPTHEWISVWADGIKIGDTLLPVGTVITAKDPDGVVCGKFTVHIPGKIGLMPIYADDPQTKTDEGAKPGQEVSIYIGDLQHAFKVTWTHFGDVICLSKQITSAEKLLHAVPKEFKLYQNHPNPFNPSTIIEYDVAAKTRVTMCLYDLLGRRVQMLVDQDQDAGSYSLKWNGRSPAGSDMPSGIYYCRFAAGSYQKTVKLMLIR